MLIVGLTGGIGAGKSTVARLLEARGAIVIDADEVARAVVEPEQPAFEQVVERFGPGVVGPDGRLDRAALAKAAFADAQARQDLEAITHPAVNDEFVRRVGSAPPDSILVLDVPLLVESATAASRGYEAVIVVVAPRDVRLARLEARGVDQADAERRMRAQASDADRRAVATHVVDNSGDLADLERQVDDVWADLERRHAEKRE